MGDRRYSRDFKLPTDEEMADLKSRYRDTPLYPKVLLLEALCEDRFCATAHLAAVSGLSERTIGRYLFRLRKEGYQKLLDLPKSSRKISSKQLDELVSQVRLGQITSYEHARRWVKKEFGITYTHSGMYQLLERVGPLRHQLREKNIEGVLPGEPVGLVPSVMVRGLNSLAVTGNVDDWMDALLKMLYILMPTVHRIALSLVPSSDPDEPLRRPDTDRHVKVSFKDKNSGEVRTREYVLPREELQNEDKRVRRTLADMESAGYFDPKTHVYMYRTYDVDGIADLGCLIAVFNNRAEMERDGKVLDILSPFLTFCLSDIIVKTRHSPSGVLELHGRVADLCNRAGLTTREKEVFLALISGKTYSKIAMQIDASVSTVKNHLSAIYRKTGVQNSSELVALLIDPLQT